MKNYKYLPVISGIFTATLVITNLLNNKFFEIFGFAFPAGILTFPLSFLIGDALTEVYGYAAARRVIWTGFGVLMFMVAAVVGSIHLPAAGFWKNQSAFAAVLSQIPRIVVASILAYFAGEFCNSYVLAKSKVRTEGRGMWVRFVTSTMAGQAVDTVVFMTVAFVGVYPPEAMLPLFLSSWAVKVLWEIVALPASVPFITWLKATEHEDYFDRGTNFSPFHIGGNKVEP